ncbi:MAG: ComF family protein [Desulfomonile sp.]
MRGTDVALSSVTSGLSFLAGAVSKVLFPPVCSLCETAFTGHFSTVCHTCLQSIKPVPEPVCPQCGLPTAGCDPVMPHPCIKCLVDQPAYYKSRFGLIYDGELRKALVRFKYHEATHLGRILSEFLVQVFRDHFKPSEFDVIVPMPMHPGRLFHRGFNQVVVLGERLSDQTGIPLDRSSFRKIRDTVPQVGLSRPHRVRNIRGSFAVARPKRIRGCSVLLLDDVSTTGSTIAEASRAIVKGGAGRVGVLVLALRVPLTNSTSQKSLEQAQAQ